ncbi:diaminopimelate epimerase [Demequina lignilytica]|uniref:Diaminopimelate epimerase n=1 Tax=Demequina lignilytica TaxID=3051663 RepID=A0AB35MJI6_9MICO|nr:diaminopimelate epimerase [Demequina sp. SYSU T0a273]MDN4483989.1 diaminopimelate epimerase [Demequina sp. SYSU T0a273]
MTTLPFTKGHGTENDFVLLYDPAGEIDLTPDRVAYLCDRRAGIGGDGVIRAVRAGALEAGAELSPDTWFMDYWNSDGTTSEMCGNGARVFGALLERHAGEDLTGGLTFGTRGGPRTVTRLDDGRYAIGMGVHRLGDTAAGFDAEVEARGLDLARPALSVDMGNPHHVVALAHTGELDALDLTAAPAVSPVPPHGSNVEFAVALGFEDVAGEHRGRVRMRVHERGSGETRSCGTGACAVALAMRFWAGLDAPDVWDVEVPGGVVTVRVSRDSTVLEGPAVLVAEGMVDLPG